MYFANCTREARHQHSPADGRRRPRKPSLAAGTAQWALSVHPRHRMGGVPVDFLLLLLARRHVKSWFNTSVCAESEQVQRLGNHLVPTFEYFSS